MYHRLLSITVIFIAFLAVGPVQGQPEPTTPDGEMTTGTTTGTSNGETTTEATTGTSNGETTTGTTTGTSNGETTTETTTGTSDGGTTDLSTSTTPGDGETTTADATVAPICQPQANCTQSSPTLCARSCSGGCRRFRNSCDLERANCPQGTPLGVWTAVPVSECQEIAVDTMGLCSSSPLRCPGSIGRCPITVGQRICVVNSNGSLCRLVANECVLRNLNCLSIPRGIWVKTEMRRCTNMTVGNQPMKCFGSRLTITTTVE